MKLWAIAVGTSLALFALSCSEAEIALVEGDGLEAHTLSGTVILRTLDQSTGSSEQYLFIDDSSGRKYVLDFLMDPLLATGEKVELAGVIHGDNLFAVSSFNILTLKPRRLDAPLVRSPKLHRVAILATQDASVTEQQALNLVNGQVDSVNSFYTEISRSIDTFSGLIFKRYNIALSATDCQYDNTDNIADALIAEFKKDGYNTANYDHIVVVVPKSCGTDWSGAWAYIGAIYDNGGVDFELISMYKDNAFDPWFLAHELGHNLGMNHARSMTCGTGPYYKANAVGCSFNEYGNYNDPMGNGEGVYFGAPYQRYMGWVGATNVATAGKSGIFNLQPSDGEMCGVRAVRIPIPFETGSYFYVEFRKARSDSRYAGTAPFGSTRQNVVLITRSGDGLGGNDSSYTDRVEVGTTRYLGATPGVRYDLGSGIAIKVLSASGASAQVSIEMPGSAAHRNDSGAQLAPESDGSFGPKSCSINNDDCPSDPNKTDPGICGCGVPDTDADKDGTADCQDGCKTDPKKTSPGQCGCGVTEGTCGNSKIYQAETCTSQSGCTLVANHAGYTGTGFMDYGGNGTWIEWNNVIVAAPGNYQLTLRYANGSVGARQSSVVVNGAAIGNVEFSSTGGWANWGTAAITVPLKAGNNTIRVKAGTTSGGPNLDSMEVKGGTSTMDECPNDPSKTIPGICGCGVADTDTDKDGTADCKDGCKNDPLKTTPGQCGCGVPEGTCSTAAKTYQAESHTSQSGCALANNHAGYTGNGFMDYGGNGTWIEWNNINVAAAGSFQLIFRYANGSAGARQASIIVNGVAVGNVAFSPTGGWPNWSTASFPTSLRVGNNTIRIQANTGSGGPNLDSMEVR